MTMLAFTFQPRYHRVTAVQFTGTDSVPIIQAFMSPFSPLYQPGDPNAYNKHAQLTVPIYDPIHTSQWPTLGKSYTAVQVPLNGWVIKLESGDFVVLPHAEFVDRYEEVPVSMQSAMQALGVAFRDPVVGDDVDPTGVVDVADEGRDPLVPGPTHAELQRVYEDCVAPGLPASTEDSDSFMVPELPRAAEATHPDDDIKF